MVSSNQAAHPACTFLSKCPVWSKFQTNSKFFWIKQYCEGPKQEHCARRKLAMESKNVPENMLPNGDTLS